MAFGSTPSLCQTQNPYGSFIGAKSTSSISSSNNGMSTSQPIGAFSNNVVKDSSSIQSSSQIPPKPSYKRNSDLKIMNKVHPYNEALIEEKRRRVVQMEK